MSGVIDIIDQAAIWIVGIAVLVSSLLMAAVVIERMVQAAREWRMRRQQRRYGPVITAALAGDAGAITTLASSPARHHLVIARTILLPLIDDRDPLRIAAARRVIAAMPLRAVRQRLLRSRFWWRRTMAIRAVGLTQDRGATADVVAALADPSVDVRNTALDALADLQDPAALAVIVVHLNDSTLDRGRRLAALASYGTQCEDLVIGLAQVDAEHRPQYARALAVCGTTASRPLLCEWLDDPRPSVRAAALSALAHIGLDDRSAALVMNALESAEPEVRAMAASALGGRADSAAVASLARHLDDEWVPALAAARALCANPTDGAKALAVRAARPGLGGVLARQMLWEANRR